MLDRFSGQALTVFAGVLPILIGFALIAGAIAFVMVALGYSLRRPTRRMAGKRSPSAMGRPQ